MLNKEKETKSMHAQANIMNPKRFLIIGGGLLVTLGLLGIVNVLGALSSAAFFHPPFWINWLHLSVGTLLLVVVVAFWGSSKWQAGITLFAAILLNTLGLLGLLVYAFVLLGVLGVHSGVLATNPQIATEFADPSDHIVHLAIGLLAVWGWINRPRSIEQTIQNLKASADERGEATR
jgi:hypothetical protein